MAGCGRVRQSEMRRDQAGKDTDMATQWHEKERLPPCGCKTTKGLLCVRPARWTMGKDQMIRRVCNAHSKLLEADGWIRVTGLYDWAF